MLTLVRQSVPRSLGETDSHAGDIGHWLGMTGLIHVRTRRRIGRFILYHKEITMQTVIDFINKHLYDVFIPLTALAVLRIIVCLAQLKHIAALRKKKGTYHVVGHNYTEIGAWLGILVGFVLVLATRLWYVGLPLSVVLGILIGKLGKKKGAELDAIYRDVAWELKHEAAAQAAREAASHTLESGAAALEEHEENTEDKGDTENG